MGHILAFSTRSIRHDAMLGSLEEGELEKLREEARGARRSRLKERKRSFIALGILLNMEEDAFTDKIIAGLGRVGEGGRSAELIRNFVFCAASLDKGKNSDLVTWYCQGGDTWITLMATRKAGKKVNLEGEENGRWFIQLGEFKKETREGRREDAIGISCEDSDYSFPISTKAENELVSEEEED
eukprot:TRINITY_DN25444_c0_g1_i1.p1 TRINITY_DN25444_c0_g1~~TRINITY_DN25444_c0_g1_i1.p1  ORF type:complete len:184 (-),score=30.56 TRINITY_DN25444_c0_g1_i1:778-1329(-)